MATRQLELDASGAKAPEKEGEKGSGHGGRGGKRRGGGDGESPPPPPADASLAIEAQRRYLNYAVSVITSRALPDVRDGLKPVQRRILYAMYANLHLHPEGRFRKSATIVGEVLGKFHPHGDTSCYDAMVRMAQPFSMRGLLVDGHGNFGSLDGDGAAAYRYTEAKLAPLAVELLSEIKQGTVDFRPNYDGTTEEPIVLPAKFPQLLVNGCTGIAVGMATNIPPHNLAEVCEAAVALIDDKDLETKDLLKYIKGPDFPTGGLVTNSKKELRDIYETGQGGVRVRAEWKSEKGNRGAETIIVTSIPYAISKSTVVERIADVIINKKLPLLVDVRDESTDDVRIVLELKGGADPALVMSYLFKHTPLEQSFFVNMTCLVPTENKEIAGPMRLDLKAMLREFLDFREETVRRRFEYELAELERRIHILEGFAKIFEILDEVIRIIRKSEGKADAAEKLIKRFELSEAQTEAILELKLYKLARLEIQLILDELRDKRAAAKEITSILGDKKKLWKVIRGEIAGVAEAFPDKRRTKLGGGGDDVEFNAEAFIVEEDATVILSRDGWLKRAREIKDLSTTRVREGDAVLAAVRGSTKEAVAIFSNFGSAYVIRVNDVPASTGYGEPVQKLFNFRDGERVVGAMLMSEAATPKESLGLGITKRGFGMRFNLDVHRELSTRAGRRFAKVAEGDEIVGIALVNQAKNEEIVCAVTQSAHALLCRVSEIPELANPGRGVTVIKTEEDDPVMGFGVGTRKDKVLLIVETDAGKEIPIGPERLSVTTRGGKGHGLMRKTKVVRVSQPLPTAPAPLLN
ncbi:MAG TPA: DNA topoisomerase IV subunit A [Vicinamibacterales bacterium]|jgi:DNA gyrase subunit A|nr:DNA topoisomerase IV subunit A [Vicinamibacterales bacterium]